MSKNLHDTLCDLAEDEGMDTAMKIAESIRDALETVLEATQDTREKAAGLTLLTAVNNWITA